MKTIQAVVGVCLLMSVNLAFAADAQFPVNGTPKWYEVGAQPSTTTVTVVRSVRTGDVLGEVGPKFRFLSFGAGPEYVTFAFKGHVAYLPLSAVSEMYPVSQSSGVFRSAGKTLEQMAAEYRSRAETSKHAPLAPNFTNMPTPRPTVDTSAASSAASSARRGRGGEPAI